MNNFLVCTAATSENICPVEAEYVLICALVPFLKISRLLSVSSSVQLQLLLQYLKDDPRKAVKRLAISDLKLLAKKAPHLWIRENTQVEFQMLTVAL